MRNALIPALALAATLPWVPVRAAIYQCPNAAGELVTSDHPTADCLANGGKELNPDGSVRRVLLSPAQQRRQQAQDEQQQQSLQRQLQQQREERALLVRYPDRASFDQARDAELHGPGALIDGARRRIARLQDDRRALDKEAQFYPDRKYPPDLRSKLDENAMLLKQEQTFIAAQQKDAARIRAQYAELLPRMEGLWSRAGAPAAAPARPGKP